MGLCGNLTAESKYRSVKKPQETIADRLAEHVSEESQTKNQVIGDEAKVNFLKCAEQFVNYQKSFATEKPLFKHEVFEAMAVAVTKMTDVLSSQRYASHKLEKLSVPIWDSVRKSCTTWKHELSVRDE